MTATPLRIAACQITADPLGGVIARLAAAPGLIFTDVDAAAAIHARGITGVLTNRTAL
ncbi:hypothetical protein MMAG44476_02025 [Mycolicibacterium mageritense DSM 44476 = CIP 104973]|uniref:Uncharacterized protein n=1 Tax=Mycolicibacterium mageritense TaxID=53462 RepID=A0AAI8XPN9_MYCME|nr:hypothetical protein [Mycolicibacterium mageritense]MCC9183304.1 hypothetical protein [Mycolicibacterium mageritense]CDO20249.1 hypothetical protein BN978_00702 [Mycolicibacterium mageritense DSM 44476 = CIP 104973]BBX35240.1 hypothetical protein MMAGJ_45220 [Mycolicibacterium mageritense]BDY30147.1 hypothetical protein hbim_04090 [Mycolicibacterium mageritense]GJJ19764.1 hypothetical protein MTY414_34370 [Mycolicibacterium mageritense]